jgi:glycosyltransferase involved in cell wall biosynthesis
LTRSLRQVGPDVVVCCNQRAVRLGVFAARLAGRLPVVFRNGLARSFKNSWLNRLVAGGVTRFVVNARALADELRCFGWVPSERVSVIYNGVDAGFYAWPPSDGMRQRWEIPTDSLVIGAAGRLVAEKGHGDLIRAAAALRERHPRLRVVIMGEGPQSGALAEQARAAGLAEVVRLVGFERQMPAALAALDIFCQPSLREGLPNAVLEAMAAGLPVVATAVDGVPEVVLEGETGYLVPPGDVPALRTRLDQLLSRSDLRHQFGRRARLLVEDQFSLSICRRSWEALLADVVAERDRGA